MGLRIPQNQIIPNKYTSGNEYMLKDTQIEYKGYYYEASGRIYAGKEFNINNPEIVRINQDNVNGLLGRASTYLYGVLSGIELPTSDIPSQPLSLGENLYDREGNLFTKFFCKRRNSNPIVIKEIDEDTYISLQKNPLFETTYIGEYQGIFKSIEEAENEVKGIEQLLTPIIEETARIEEEINTKIPPQQLFEIVELATPKFIPANYKQQQFPVYTGVNYIPEGESIAIPSTPGTLKLIIDGTASPVAPVNSATAWSSFFGLLLIDYFTEVEVSNVPFPDGTNKRQILLKGGRITSIPKFTFENINYLYSIEDLAGQITIIKQQAFNGCSTLISCAFPNVTIIENSGFDSNSSLSYCYIPNINSIGDYSFFGCTSFGSDISSNIIGLDVLVTVGANAFEFCTNIERLYLPSATTIGANAISNMSKLYGIDIKNCTSLGYPNLTNLVSQGDLPPSSQGNIQITRNININALGQQAIDELKNSYDPGIVVEYIYP